MSSTVATDDRALVSVIVPMYNGERHARAALETVFAQDYRPIEVIVVDSSDDTTGAIVRSFDGVRHVYQPKQGPAAARNLGIRTARGELIAFNDADDLWTRDKLAVQIEYLRTNRDVDAVISHLRLFIDGSPEDLPPMKRHLFESEPVGWIPQTLLARRAVFDRAGYFDESYSIADDTDWLVRARDLGVRFGVVPECLLLKRIHGSNLTLQSNGGLNELPRLLKASLDRRRRRISDGGEDGDDRGG